MAIKEMKKKDITWINIDRVDKAAIDFLKKNYSFHHLDIEDLQGDSQTPKIDVYKNYLFLVLRIPQWNKAAKQLKAHELDIFVGKDYLITIQHTKNKEIKNFFYRCMNNRTISQEWFSQGTGYLLYNLVEGLFQEARKILNALGKDISAVENEIFAGEQDVKEIKALALLRRNVLYFRRIIDPQRYLMSNLSHLRKSFLDEQMSLYFDDARDYLDKLWSIVETYKETIEGLHLTVESIINQRTNKVISVLTVTSAALLPLTLLSGIYGMNIDLPFAHRPAVVWSAFVVLLVIILVAIGFMKRHKWL